MPKYFENCTEYPFTWDQVAQAFWRRYPNPNSKHVLTEDTVSREVKGGCLLSKRILSKTNSIPNWAKRFINANHVYIIEESYVDTKNKILVTYTRNLGYAKVMSVIEKVVYKESEDNPGHTEAIRSAWIDSQVRGFSKAICAFGYERFRKNANKMVSGFTYVLSNMFPSQNHGLVHPNMAFMATSKLKDAAKNASELAKAKAAPIYASLHPQQT